MGIFDSDLAVKHPEEERNGPRLLDAITELTGGRHYPVSSIDQLPEISEKIGRELRSQYVLGYYSNTNVNPTGIIPRGTPVNFTLPESRTAA